MVRDPDGECLDHDGSSVVLHVHGALVRAAAEATLATVEEVEAIVLDVERNQIATCSR